MGLHGHDLSEIMKMDYPFLLLVKSAKFMAASFIHVLNGCMAQAVKGITFDLCKGKLVQCEIREIKLMKW